MVVAPLVSVLSWGEVTEAGLVALPVVEDLDELEQVGVALGSSGEPDRASDPRDLDFQSRPERFHGCVVERVARQSRNRVMSALPAANAKSNDVYCEPLSAWWITSAG